MGIAIKERCGRVNVVLDDGRVVTADYRATPHRLEIRIGDQRLIRGATDWCNAIKWGYEYEAGLEVKRTIAEVIQHFLDEKKVS